MPLAKFLRVKEMRMLISEAFRQFKAIQKNVNYSVSAFKVTDELILSLWEQYFKPTQNNGEKTMTYVDRASRWGGHGNKEFINSINLAQKNKSKIRAIIAKTNLPQVVDEGGDDSNLVNSFFPKLDWIGRLTVWDGDNFEIEFSRVK